MKYGMCKTLCASPSHYWSMCMLKAYVGPDIDFLAELFWTGVAQKKTRKMEERDRWAERCAAALHAVPGLIK